MLEFHSVTPADRLWLEPILFTAGEPAADYSFVNIYAWAEAFKMSVCRLGERVTVRGTLDGRTAYSFPVGHGPLVPAVESILADARENGRIPAFTWLTEPDLDDLSEAFPGAFTFTELRDREDYIYSARRLALLEGRKLHAKRTHIRRFEETHPDWSFTPMTAGDTALCRELDDAWTGERTDPVPEQEALRRCLESFDALGLVGGILRVNGEAAAFTMASRVSPDTFDVHFEKARPGMEDTYPVINREMARYLSTLGPEELWLNREDDMGLDGLRKAKCSYQPDLLLHKWEARLIPTKTEEQTGWEVLK